MARQFPKVNSTYGAPMGRACYGIPENCEARSVRLFRVALSGDYDDGGAYWGSGRPLYCATDGAEYRQFTRANSRDGAAVALGLSAKVLKIPTNVQRSQTELARARIAELTWHKG